LNRLGAGRSGRGQQQGGRDPFKQRQSPGRCRRRELTG
jgi:hypothetical protein